MTSPPILCLGAGAIGSLVGARLTQAGVSVGLVGRGAHVEAVRRSGLVLEEAGRSVRLAVPAYGSLEEAFATQGVPTALVLAVKNFDAGDAAAELAGALEKWPGRSLAGRRGAPPATPTVLCLQNGLGAEEAVARHLGPRSVLAGAITLSVERPEPGRVKLLTTHGGITVAPGDLAGPGAAGLVGNLRAAGFRLRLHRRPESVKWSKVLLNLWANASSAVFDKTPAQVVADDGLFHLDWACFREALRVMTAAGIPAVDLPGYPVRLLALAGRVLPEGTFRRLLGRRVVGGRGGKMPSLWLDLHAGRRRLEVGALNGAVAAAGRNLGLPTPANESLARALDNLAAGRLRPDRYSSSPGRLLEG